MAKQLKFRIGVSDDPMARQPSLNDCLEAMLKHSDLLVKEMLTSLVGATSPDTKKRVAGFQQPGVKAAVLALSDDAVEVALTYKAELTRLVYEGGGKDERPAEAPRFEDLNLFEDADLDQSIEVARAQQEVSVAVDDVLPGLDALISTLLGWRTIQPGLNPIRPEMFVRALQATLARHMPDAPMREVLLGPAAGMLGVNLRRFYRELHDWLASCGIEPAVPIGGRAPKAGKPTSQVVDSVQKTLLTLDRLRKLLHGDFDAGKARVEFLHTVPASMSLLQELKAADKLIKKLQERPKPAQQPDAQPQDMLAARENVVAEPAAPRIGVQLGAEVVRLMFENLTGDARLMPAFAEQLAAMEPGILKLAERDSRFFSDRNHPARQFLERIAQRSLGYSDPADPGWQRFLGTVKDAVKWLDSKVVDADTFAELLKNLDQKWAGHDEALHQRREEAARALLHAEQRNLLAAEFAQSVKALPVPDFVAEFLRTSWAQVVAEAQLSAEDGATDPHGYRAIVDDLAWSVQPEPEPLAHAQRLVQMIPGLLAKLREGLDRIGYPPELTARFFNRLIVVHREAVEAGREAAAQAVAAGADGHDAHLPEEETAEAMIWLDQKESEDSGWIEEPELVPEPAASTETPVPEEPPASARAPELRTGSWIDLSTKGEWIRAQLTWASPAGTLFMFTSPAGSAHSMSRRTLDRLRSKGLIKIVAERNVVDEALDLVAKTALKNTLEAKR